MDIYSTFNVNEVLTRLKGQMNAMQIPAVAKAQVGGRVIFDMWMGTGKTLAALTSILTRKPKRVLIIRYKRADATTWYDEIEKWIPEFDPATSFININAKSADKRMAQWKSDKVFYVVTAASFVADLERLGAAGITFDAIVADEIHKLGLRNHKSKFFKYLYEYIRYHEKMKRPVDLVALLTGTWTSKSIPQRWAALHLLDRQTFPSYWQFVNTFNYVVDGPFGKVIGLPKNMEAFAKVIGPYVHTITKDEAGLNLPPLQRIRLPAILSPKVAKAYWSMFHHMFLETEDEVMTVANVLAKYTKLRQLINCPGTVDPTLGAGDAIETILEKMQENDELPNWKHNLIFTPYKSAIPIFKKHIAETLGIAQGDILTVQGGMEASELQKVEDRFRKNRETMVIGVIAASQGWNCESALNVYFPHFDWDQQENEQAEARSRRFDGVQELIRSYYLSFRGTITEDMFDALNGKTQINNMSYSQIVALNKKLAAQARGLANKLGVDLN